MMALVCSLILFPPVQLGGQTPWGPLVQSGNNLAIAGGLWTATGRIRDSGVVELWWISGERHATGFYLVLTDADGGTTLSGSWGWNDETEVIDGDLCGEIHAESFRIERKSP